jgi:hypothetical protein
MKLSANTPAYIGAEKGWKVLRALKKTLRDYETERILKSPWAIS